MRAHEQDDKAHLNKALDGMIKLEDTVIKLQDTVTELEDRAVELEKKVTQLQNDNATLTEALESDKKVLGKGEPMIFKLTEFKKKINK